MELKSSIWRISSYTGGNGGNCVEVGECDNAIAVRDTKDRKGVVLTIGTQAFREFVASLKRQH